MGSKLRIAYANVHVTDLKRSVEFFEKTLGLELKFSDDKFGYASFDAGPIGLGIAQIDPTDGSNLTGVGVHTGIGFAVDDLEAAHADLAGQGVEFTMQPTKQPWGGFMALFADPDGNVYYLDQIEAH